MYALQRIFCVQNAKYRQSKVQAFLAWVRKVLEIRSPEFKWSLVAREGGRNRTRQADCPVISEYTNLKKLLVVGSEKGSILQDGVKCVLHIRSKVKRETCKFRFTKGLVLRNTIRWRTTRLSTCSFCSLGLRSIIYSVKLWVRMCYEVEHSKRLKRPVTKGI